MGTNYQKINTLFKRDEKGIIMPSEMTCAEFEYLKDCKWECTEKIDGTNIHVDAVIEAVRNEDGTCTSYNMECTIHGRTSKAVIPPHLLTRLTEIFELSEAARADGSYANPIIRTFHDSIMQTFEQQGGSHLYLSIYGEGYGRKIQKSGGSYMKDDCGFILFDVKVNDWWLKREACEGIAELLNVPIVPIVGYMTIAEAIDYVKDGFKSTVAEDKEFEAEGLVLKTPSGMLFRNGERIITKLKTGDFRKYATVYGKK